jgi:hypothetical protein
LLVFSPILFAQSRETGAIIGTIVDEESTPLPGVSVTLTSPNLMGARTFVSEADGSYRFPALRPGTYTLKAELTGFKTIIREDIRLTTTTRLTVDITMPITSIDEEVTVVGVSPTVDVQTSETASVTLTNELLRNIPSFQFVSDLINLAPGVSDDVAYGSSWGTGISYQVDGVDVGDPESGTAWVFLDYNSVEEMKVMGIGMNAEYGAFSGVIFNTITKSGGNNFAGHAEFIFQDTKKGFWSAENNQDYIEDFEDLASPLRGMLDGSFHLGGPILKDKLWFFLGLQYYRSKERPAGFLAPNFRDYKQPRFFGKISSQISPKFNLTGFVEIDAYTGINRRASATHPTPDTCVSQTSPEFVTNVNMTYILSPKTFVDMKAAFFTGYYYLEPQGEGTAVFSADLNQWLNNSNWWYKADRKRFQANASLSHFTEDFIQGDHDFKFGAEFEYGWARSRYGYTGPDSWYVYDYYGSLYAYQFEGYDLDNHYTRTEFFAQDSWSITKNFTLNFGARFSLLNGYAKDVSGPVYKTDRIAPRVGFAWDIFGDHTTVLKGHYGQFTESMFTVVCNRFNPPSAWSDQIGYSYDEGAGEWNEDYRVVHEQIGLADNIRHPYMDQFTFGIERELFKNASFGISYIYRKWKNILGLIDTVGDYEPVTIDDPLTADSYTVYNQLNAGEFQRVMTNPKKGDPLGTSYTIPDDVYRKYQGIEVLFNKRMSNRWQLLLSYVYSKCTGTIDNWWGGDDLGLANNAGLETNDPNYWINVDGRCVVDPTHMFKAQGTYLLPGGINLSAYFRYLSGFTYTRQLRTPLDQGRVTFLTEERGARRYPALKNLDLRLEKMFTLANRYRIGLMVDIFNVFNDSTVTDWGTRVDYDWTPDNPGPDGHEVYGLVDPRAVRVGVRFFF